MSAPTLAQDKETEPPLVKVNVDLVQVEAVVTDSKGDYVTSLTGGDFSVRENGLEYPIKHFQFIPVGILGRDKANAESLPTDRPSTSSTQPAENSQQSNIKRSIVIFVDDLGMSSQSFAYVHSALENWIEGQIHADDLVAIVSSSGQVGGLQQMTSDRRVLRAAVRKLHSIPNRRIGIQEEDFSCYWFNHRSLGNKAAIGVTEQDEDSWLLQQPFCPGCQVQPQDEVINDRRNLYYGLITLAAMRRTTEALKGFPGQKSIVLFSEGIPLQRVQGLGDVNQQVVDSYNAMLTEAGRLAVSLDSIDSRGAVAFTPGQDSPPVQRLVTLSFQILSYSWPKFRTKPLVFLLPMTTTYPMPSVAF